MNQLMSEVVSSRPENYSFEGTNVRVVDREGEPWFVAADVFDVLGLSRDTNHLESLDEDEKGTNSIRTPGGPQTMNIISESGLYGLTFRSRKEEAKRFRKWVTSVVLPSIRKTGGYIKDEELADTDRPSYMPGDGVDGVALELDNWLRNDILVDPYRAAHLLIATSKGEEFERSYYALARGERPEAPAPSRQYTDFSKTVRDRTPRRARTLIEAIVDVSEGSGRVRPREITHANCAKYPLAAVVRDALDELGAQGLGSWTSPRKKVWELDYNALTHEELRSLARRRAHGNALSGATKDELIEVLRGKPLAQVFRVIGA